MFHENDFRNPGKHDEEMGLGVLRRRRDCFWWMFDRCLIGVKLGIVGEMLNEIALSVISENNFYIDVQFPLTSDPS